MKNQEENFQTLDAILPLIQLSDPCDIQITITEDEVLLQVGPRDWAWDRKTKELIGCGTLISDELDESI